MVTSVRCTFQGKFLEKKPHRAEGRQFAKILTSAFASGATYDLWKDFGWIVFAPLEVNIFFARYNSIASLPWQLVIECRDKHSFLHRLLRSSHGSNQLAIQMAAALVHRLLNEQSQISDVCWSLTGNFSKDGAPSPKELRWPLVATGNVECA